MYLGAQLLAARLVEMVEHVLNLTLVLVLMDGQGMTVAKVSFPNVIFFHYTLPYIKQQEFWLILDVGR